VPKLGNSEGYILLPKTGTYIAEEGNKEMAVPEIEKEEAISVSKVETYLLTYSLHGLSPQVNYTNRATATCRRSQCQLLQIEGATWSK
jgi:hypothetical protein